VAMVADVVMVSMLAVGVTFSLLALIWWCLGWLM